MFGKKDEQKQCQRIRKYHHQILITGRHRQKLDDPIASGSGETEQKAGAQRGEDLPVSENQRRDGQIAIPYIDRVGEVRGNGIGEADAPET